MNHKRVLLIAGGGTLGTYTGKELLRLGASGHRTHSKGFSLGTRRNPHRNGDFACFRTNIKKLCNHITKG